MVVEHVVEVWPGNANLLAHHALAQVLSFLAKELHVGKGS